MAARFIKTPGLKNAGSAFAKKTLSITGKASFEISDPYLKVFCIILILQSRRRADGAKKFPS
jgi:hypothetical protein